MMDRDGTAATPTDYACPRCGGTLRERRDGASLVYECRIGDNFTAAELWVEHCAARNRTIRAAVRSLEENAALAWELAAWTRQRGNTAAAARLEEEAGAEERHLEQARRMLDGLEGEGEDAGLGG